jgi:ribosome-binding factor A
LRNKVRDPRVADVKITDVQLTGDLSQATVYYSLLSTLASDNQKAAQALKKATGLFRSELAKRMSIYRIPELTFEKDQSVEYGSKIDELLRGLNKSEY